MRIDQTSAFDTENCVVLGTTLSEHNRRKYGFSFMLFGLVLIGLSVFPGIYAFQPDSIGPLITALTVLLIGFSMLIFGWFRRNDTITVLQRGLCIKTRKQHLHIRWGEVATIRIGVRETYINHLKVSTHTQLALKITDGKTEKIDSSYSNCKVLFSKVLEEVDGIHLKEFGEKLEAGQTVSFGKMSLTKDNLILGKATIALANVKELFVQSGKLYLKRNDKLLTHYICPYSEIDNPNVFFKIMDSKLKD